MAAVSTPAQGWFGLSAAAHYADLSPDILRTAITDGELEAYERPDKYRRGRGDRKHYRIAASAVDAWIRDYWIPAIGA